MPLRFLLVLVTYLVLVAACFRANNLLAAGLINTATLGIVLFAALMAWNARTRRSFWLGFLLFFTGLNAWYFTGENGAYLLDVTLADVAGPWIDSLHSGAPFGLGPVFRDHVWYGFLAHCFMATIFGVGGGFLAMATIGDARHTSTKDRAV